MPAPKNYYDTLGVDEHADGKAIKAAYHRLARQYHPDVSGKAGEEKFKEINEAYEILSDPKRREEYDRLRRGYAENQSRRQGTGFRRVSQDWSTDDLGDFGSLFDDLFGGGRQSTRPAAPAVPEESVRLTLEQVFTGTTVTVTVTDMKPCVVCHGGDAACPRCGGLGQVAEPRRYDVSIPPGIADGDVLRVGDHARLLVEVSLHPRFVRQTDNLVGRLLVAVPTAAVGGEVAVQPLVGEAMMVKIPRHTNHGRVLRLRGMGLPHRGSNSRGDMLLEVVLRFPEPFTAEDDGWYQLLSEQHQETGGEIRAPR